MLLIKVKTPSYCTSKNSFGETIFDPNKEVITINISTKKNKNQAEFYVTLLHELLHVWVAVMKANRAKVKHEHKFIYRCEDAIIKELKRLSKETKSCTKKHKFKK